MKLYSTQRFDYDVIIIGAGLSGLSTAFYLAQRDPHLNVLILEKHKHLGGFALTTDIGELGFKYITQKHLEVWDLTELLGVEFIQKESTVDWSQFSHWHGLKGTLSRFETLRFIEEMNVKCEEYNPKRPIRKSNQTMEDIVVKKLFFEQSQNFVRFVIRAVFGVEAEHIFLHEFLATCFTCLSFTDLIDSLLKGEYTPQGGWSHVVQRISTELPDSYKILTENCVIKLNKINQNHVVIQTHVEKTYHSKCVVLACPWENIKEIMFDPIINPHITSRIRKHRSFVVAFIVKYSVSAWNRMDHTGFIFDYKNRFYCTKIHPCILSGVLYVNSLRDIPPNMLHPILQLLGYHFGVDGFIPLESKLKLQEQAVLIDFPTREPTDIVIWASTNNSHRFKGFINGAVHSGIQAAISVLKIIRPSTVTYADDIDTDDVRCVNVDYFKRWWLGMNITTGVRFVKLLSAACVLHQIYKRYAKEWINEWLQVLQS